jgi:deoxyribonuclease-4
MATIRVRQIIHHLNTVQRSELKKLLPPKVSCPDFTTAKYPSALLSILPEDDVGPHAYLGILAEELLRCSPSDITVKTLVEVIQTQSIQVTAEQIEKVKASNTTQPFIDSLVTTRQLLDKVLRKGAEEGELHFEDEVICDSVAGHPDMWNKTQVFEVKLSGQLNNPKEKARTWTDFLFQVFAYGAIMPTVTDLYLVLPLQKSVWHYDIRSWKTREEYKTFLTSWSTKTQTQGVEARMKGQMLILSRGIGTHVKKAKTIFETATSLYDPLTLALTAPSLRTPYQIFLSGPQNSNMKIDEKDFAATKAFIQQYFLRLYVHSQYLINLANKDTEDAWHEKLLIKNLQITRAFGGLGVVVHVGKSVKLPKQEAIEQMRGAISRCLEHATEECPLLLETPAGQGTELLTDMKEFLDFVQSFGSSKLRVCVDTCHVFASGQDPLTYIQECHARKLLRLVHFNDSLGECGSCVDRHAHVASGEGLIGFDKMTQIANFCYEKQLPMIIE